MLTLPFCGVEQKDPSSVILMHSKPYHAYHKRRTSMTVKILLDTDIGSDIDDAVCLAYLLAEPRCELLGVTTVSGRPRERAALVDAVCRAAGRSDVPIVAGLEHGYLSRAVVQPEVPQAGILERFPHADPDELAGDAVAFLAEQIRARPG